MHCKPLTKAEKQWIKDVQAVLDKCPSDRFGFFTIGDPSVTVIDKAATDLYEKAQGYPEEDYCLMVREAGSELGTLRFPAQVASTAG